MIKDIKIGIDPGLGGAIAILREETKSIVIHDMPIMSQPWSKPRKSGKIQKMVDVVKLKEILSSYPACQTQVNLEAVGGMPTDGGHRAFIFGGAFYSVVNVLMFADYTVHYVAAATWKAKLGLTLGTKEHSRQLALNLFPDLEELIPKRKSKEDRGQTKEVCQGRAEAVLIGLY